MRFLHRNGVTTCDQRGGVRERRLVAVTEDVNKGGWCPHLDAHSTPLLRALSSLRVHSKPGHCSLHKGRDYKLEIHGSNLLDQHHVKEKEQFTKQANIPALVEFPV